MEEETQAKFDAKMLILPRPPVSFHFAAGHVV